MVLRNMLKIHDEFYISRLTRAPDFQWLYATPSLDSYDEEVSEQGIFVRLTKVWIRLFVFYMNDISSLGLEF